jgi:hypothetical protein
VPTFVDRGVSRGQRRLIYTLNNAVFWDVTSCSVLRLLVSANVILRSPILVTLMMEAIRSSETSVFQEPQGVTSQRTAFFIVTAVKTLNLTSH